MNTFKSDCMQNNGEEAHLSSDVLIGCWAHQGETDQENILDGHRVRQMYKLDNRCNQTLTVTMSIAC